jgi:tripartite-type tricarboxylate transporter receptor subunit TctC
MNPSRRHFLRLAAGFAAVPAPSSIASAQSYPARPVRLVAPWPAGGVVDLFARLIGQWLSERLGQPFVIENRAGAGGNVGTEMVVKAAPDGYTLLMTGANNSWNATLCQNLNFDFARDIVPVGGICHGVGVLVVHPSFPMQSVPELITYARSNPGRINAGTGGVGSGQHVYAELFRMMTGVDITYVHYRGGAPALRDLLSGQLHIMFDSLPISIEHIRAGKLRALAVTSATPSEALPGVPTVGDFVPGYEARTWIGVGAPRATPPHIIEMLNREINAGLADPKTRTRITELGYTVFASSPAELDSFNTTFTEKWAKVIRFSGAKAE